MCGGDLLELVCVGRVICWTSSRWSRACLTASWCVHKWWCRLHHPNTQHVPHSHGPPVPCPPPPPPTPCPTPADDLRVQQGSCFVLATLCLARGPLQDAVAAQGALQHLLDMLQAFK